MLAWKKNIGIAVCLGCHFNAYKVTKGESEYSSIKFEYITNPIARYPQLNPYRPNFSSVIFSVTTMQPPTRSTRSNPSPGLIDRPRTRRSAADVAQEKAKKQQAATSKAEDLRRRTAQVGEVEREIRRAQAEALPARQGGKGKITKKTFPRPDRDVSTNFSDLHVPAHRHTDPHTSPL